MNTNKLLAVGGEYLADALKIALVWFISVMTLSGAAFANLTHQGALITLALSFAVWLSACVSHYLATGQADPPAPAVKPDIPPAPPPTLEPVVATLTAALGQATVDLANVSANLKAALGPPAPPAAP